MIIFILHAYMLPSPLYFDSPSSSRLEVPKGEFVETPTYSWGPKLLYHQLKEGPEINSLL